jgi:hypothetical protein
VSKSDVPLVARVFPELSESLGKVQPTFTPVGLAHVLKHRYQSEEEWIRNLRHIMQENEWHMNKLLETLGEELENPHLIWSIR